METYYPDQTEGESVLFIELPDGSLKRLEPIPSDEAQDELQARCL